MNWSSWPKPKPFRPSQSQSGPVGQTGQALSGQTGQALSGQSGQGLESSIRSIAT